MKHTKKCDEMLMLYYFDELDIRDAATFKKHLAQCAHCQAEYKRLQEVGDILAQAPEEVPTPTLMHRANAKIMERITVAEQHSLFFRIKQRFNHLIEKATTILAQPKYQLVGIGMAFVIGILVGKLWVSSDLRHDPQMLFNIVNSGATLTENERDYLKKTLANYMLQSGDIQVEDVLENVSTQTDESGMVEVGFKIERDFALKGGLDDPTIQNMLKYSALHDKNPERRKHAVRLLSNARPVKGIEETLSAVLLHDPEAEIRLQALQTLASYSALSENSIEALKSVVLRDSSAILRRQAIEQLRTVKGDNVATVIALVSVRDKDSTVRAKAKDVLQDLNLDQDNKPRAEQ